MDDLKDSTSIKDGTDDTFMVDVIEASKKLPIIVDFWAPWCGPCKTLGPSLEAAVVENQKKIKLIKINIDENPAVAGQLRVQSIPAVFAFSNGQPVDGFMGAQSNSQIREFIKKIVDGFAPEDDALSSAIKSANELLNAKEYKKAIEVFRAIIAQDPNLPEAHAGLIKSLLNNQELPEAKLAFETIPDSIKTDGTIKTIHAQIQLANQTSSVGNLLEVKEKFLSSPDNLNLKFEFALALIAENQNQEAIDVLLQIIQKEFDWNEGKAKKQLIEFLDALGPESPEGRAGRRNLSSILFS